jgi:hypothetical protein
MIDAIHKVSPPIDGIYYAKREMGIFQEKVKHLVDKIVKRSEDLINLRGFVLDDSCDFEIRIKGLLNLAWEKFPDKQKEQLEESLCRHIEDPVKRHEKSKCNITSEKPYYLRAVNDRYFFNHSDRLYLLTKVIEIMKSSYGFVPEKKHISFKSNYEEDISCYRNALGHRKSSDTNIEIAGKQIPIDSLLHKKMRHILTIYDGLIHGLETFLSDKI